jgi:hypothetical protein
MSLFVLGPKGDLQYGEGALEAEAGHCFQEPLGPSHGRTRYNDPTSHDLAYCTRFDMSVFLKRVMGSWVAKLILPTYNFIYTPPIPPDLWAIVARDVVTGLAQFRIQEVLRR